MRISFSKLRLAIFAVPAILAYQSFDARPSLACACGCGVFDVGTSSMFPTGSGNVLYFEYDYLDQDRNWSGSASAPAQDNPDKLLVSHFFVLGDQYMLNRSWGIQLDLPVTYREFQTADPDTSAVGSFNHSALGDIRIHGIYTGFSSDMSTGLSFGLKLPTGDFTYSGFDPDTEIGSGSTDLLLGFFHVGSLGENSPWNWFTQLNLDQPLLTQNGYIPGNEIDGAVGAYYNGFVFGGTNKLAPLLQLLTSLRASDHGGNPDADPIDTGYERLLVSPGAELDLSAFRLYVDVEFPVYQYMNGNQLVGPFLLKTIVSYGF